MILFWCVSFLLTVYCVIVLTNYLLPPPSDLGVKNQRLSPCPDSPNCVCSQCESPIHFIEPIKFSGSGEKALKRLAEILSQQQGCRIINHEGDYLYAEFCSFFFRFVDDVEFWVDSSENVIQVRSASRVGYSDMGTNRKRIDKLRQLFANRDQ
ncbi:DUF1499 domain-containing protein [Gimesia aquarii]|uniref:DUF1499 domain-containing protein n=1 Tax=Gimesia aquarii TaxID=2527964 RepID=A0A517WUS7_9PLAN|nr:DUF1499 domain-containing protein [Gimesia aquarii]QDU08994.1 hypothetical protein V202x_23640 [Gimesia aquarii]